MPKIKTKAATTKKVTTVKRWPSRDWLMFWLLVMANVALVAAIFGNVDVRTLKQANSVNSEVQTDEQASQTEIKYLKDELDTAQARIDEYEQSVAEQGNWNSVYEKECYLSNETISGKEADGPVETYVAYLEPKTSVRMSIPYSLSWGTPNCPPITVENRLEESLASISFGPAVGVEGGEMRDSAIGIAAPTSTSSMLAQIKTELAGSEEPSTPIKQRVINGLTVYSYYDNFGLGGLHRWIAVGRNYTYRLSSVRWLTDAEAIKIIQSLRMTK